MSTIEIGYLVIIVVALCEGAKYAGLKARFIPLLSAVLGLIGALYWGGATFLAAGAGVIVGLATTGGYRLIKTSLLNK